MLTSRQTLFQTEIEYVRALTELRQAVVEIEGLLLTGGLEEPGEGVSAGGMSSGGGSRGGGGTGMGGMASTPKAE